MNAKQLQKEMALWIVRLNTDDLHERQQAQIEFEAWLCRAESSAPRFTVKALVSAS